MGITEVLLLGPHSQDTSRLTEVHFILRFFGATPIRNEGLWIMNPILTVREVEATRSIFGFSDTQKSGKKNPSMEVKRTNTWSQRMEDEFLQKGSFFYWTIWINLWQDLWIESIWINFSTDKLLRTVSIIDTKTLVFCSRNFTNKSNPKIIWTKKLFHPKPNKPRKRTKKHLGCVQKPVVMCQINESGKNSGAPKLSKLSAADWQIHEDSTNKRSLKVERLPY